MKEKQMRIETGELFSILYNTINGADFDDLYEAVYKIYDVAGYRKHSDDLAEVVRCKNCDRSRPMMFDGYCYCKRYRVVRKKDDFCSRGKNGPEKDGKGEDHASN